MNRVIQNPIVASRSCAARAADACFRAASDRASEAPNGIVVVRAFPLWQARREVSS